MRVTSKMLTTNMLSNINKNKLNVGEKADQYSTQQKIQRPSQDPVIAVRSLKFSSTYTQISQYVDKNIPDAMSWMEQTESAMDDINDVLSKMNTYFDQGANDTLETTDRDALVKTLTQYKEQIYQCLNADNAGRYLFTGYRTDQSYIYDSEDESKKYTITEKCNPLDIKEFSYVQGNVQYIAGNSVSAYASDAVQKKSAYKISLAYNGIDNLNALTYNDGAVTHTVTAGTVDLNNEYAFDVDAYNTANGTSYDVLFIEETGEVIMSDTQYDVLSKAKSIQAVYDKSLFSKGDVRPEHNFDCQSDDLDTAGNIIAGTTKQYLKPQEQEIQYEVNFSQKITVNTMGNQVMDFSLMNQMDDVISQISIIQKTEAKLDDVETKLRTGNYIGSKNAIIELRKQVTNELTIHKNILQEYFGNGLTTVKNIQASVTKANADLGSRYQRLELTEARLDDEKTNIAEMITENDKVDLEDAVINYTSAVTAYNASLNAASKVVKNSLLDFL